ncbi:MAG: LPXTG cell wall anchor domain-containing protein, partial [Eubacterium sp.]|nr:LPXTG cell wall anchor domain-containing protein [Eubacterium sp.]
EKTFQSTNDDKSYLVYKNSVWKLNNEPITAQIISFEDGGISKESKASTAFLKIERDEISTENNNSHNIQIYKKLTIPANGDVTYTFTNKIVDNPPEPSSVTLNILKVNANGMSLPIQGAEFTLNKLDPDDKGALAKESEALFRKSAETGTDGRTVISDIPDGYYEISETKIPTGYVLVDDGKFYIHVSAGTITMLSKDPDKLVKNWGELTSSDKILYDASTNTVTVGNTPGTQLPSTGGEGTELFARIGAFLASTAGLALLLRKRKEA